MHPNQLKQLFDDLSPALVLYARQWCRSPDDAVQEAFVDLFNTASKPNCPRSWLYTTTRRKAQNIARSEQRRRKHHEKARQDLNESIQTWFLPKAEQLVAADVADALESLESQQRELIVARVWGELSFEELAKLMECSVSSAHRRYATAIDALKKLVREHGVAQKKKSEIEQGKEETQQGFESMKRSTPMRGS